ncbi:MAG TPA: hypothetical protein EYH34_10215 [Planctomycetes bacterium]|nr:hypothetical protein [Planctomycetota bacterium]
MSGLRAEGCRRPWRGPRSAATRLATPGSPKVSNKEWVQRVLDHQDGLPVPYHLPLSPQPRRSLEVYYGTEEVEAFLDLPIRMAGPRSIKPLYAHPQQFGPRAVDEFGVVWATSPIDRGSPVGPCLNAPTLKGYRFPDPSAPYRFAELGPWCCRNASQYTILWIGDLWERASFMCGMEQLLTYVALQKPFVADLLEAIAQYVLGTLEVLLERFAFDGVALSDDYGTQRALVISPRDWRQLIKPRLARIIARAKAGGKAVMLHSCGNVRAIVPDLVDLGLDILHPIQPEAMDILELKRQFGRHLTFFGGLGTQQTLVQATPEQLRQEVRRLQRAMGWGGGYLLEPAITIQADVPLENILAFLDAAAGAARCGRP